MPATTTGAWWRKSSPEPSARFARPTSGSDAPGAGKAGKRPSATATSSGRLKRRRKPRRRRRTSTGIFGSARHRIGRFTPSISPGQSGIAGGTSATAPCPTLAATSTISPSGRSSSMPRSPSRRGGRRRITTSHRPRCQRDTPTATAATCRRSRSRGTRARTSRRSGGRKASPNGAAACSLSATGACSFPTTANTSCYPKRSSRIIRHPSRGLRPRSGTMPSGCTPAKPARRPPATLATPGRSPRPTTWATSPIAPGKRSSGTRKT